MYQKFLLEIIQDKIDFNESYIDYKTILDCISLLKDEDSWDFLEYYKDFLEDYKDFLNNVLAPLITQFFRILDFNNKDDEVSVFPQVESMNAIPIIDINPKNSVLLKELKEKESDLLEFVRKTFKTASREVKLKLRAALRSISEKRGAGIPIEEKMSILRALTKIIGQKILSKGLLPKELQIAEQIRRDILVLRRKIRKIGMSYEKKVGLMALVYGTIEWLLIYSIRG